MRSSLANQRQDKQARGGSSAPAIAFPQIKCDASSMTHLMIKLIWDRIALCKKIPHMSLTGVLTDFFVYHKAKKTLPIRFTYRNSTVFVFLQWLSGLAPRLLSFQIRSKLMKYWPLNLQTRFLCLPWQISPLNSEAGLCSKITFFIIWRIEAGAKNLFDQQKWSTVHRAGAQ